MSAYSTYSNEQLLELLNASDEAAFTELFCRYRQAVRTTSFYLLKSNELAEDVVQEIFMQLWKDRSKAATISNVEAWMFIAARNCSLKKFRRVQLQQDYLDYLTATISFFDNSSTSDLVEFKYLRESIEKAIASLPPQQQMAFRLSREKGLTHAEIAYQMNISHRTASDYILKAIHHIRAFLSQRAVLALVLFLGRL